MAKKSSPAGTGVKRKVKPASKPRASARASSVKAAVNKGGGSASRAKAAKPALKPLAQDLAQRKAELQIINSVQQGLAAKLDFQSIVNLVGDHLRKIFATRNIGIRWYDTSDNVLHYIYEYEHDKRLSIPSRPPTPGGIFETILKHRKPIILNNPADYKRLNVTTLPGTDVSKSMINVPILSNDRVLGHIIIENYERANAYGESELRLLTTIAASLGTALENARLFDETQQRNAELAIVNSVQLGLASKLDMQAIFELVGEKIRTIFDAQSTIIATYEYAKEQALYRYVAEKGDRFDGMTMPFNGFHKKMIEERKTILYNENLVEQVRALGYEDSFSDNELPKSALNVPLLVGKQVMGHVALENLDREHAFSDSDVRLLETLANSMSVALESARLFDETQRLLKVTEERAAELAIINSVQEGLVAHLDFNAIIHLVGNKLYEIFKVSTVQINIYDPGTNLLHTPFCFEEGNLHTHNSRPPTSLQKKLLDTKETIVTNENLWELARQEGINQPPAGKMPLSEVDVPLVVKGEARGYISLQDNDHEHTFTESIVRLVTTLANSMSVALENARLFDETQRLLKETEQRNAELAIINSVQASLAAKLDMQGIYNAVGDKIREIFKADTTYIAFHDKEKNLIVGPYYTDRDASNPFSRPYGEGLTEIVIESKKPLLLNSAEEQNKVGVFNRASPGSDKDLNQSFLGVPLFRRGEAIGVASVQSYQPSAYGQNDLRLLTTLTNSMSVALENARLFDETQRLFKESEERAAELQIINRVGEEMSRQLDVQTIARTVGDNVTEIFKADATSILILDEKAGMIVPFYEWDEGKYIENVEPFPLGKGLTSQVIQLRRALVLGSAEEAAEHGVYYPPEAAALNPTVTQSYLGVPIIAGERVIGVVSVNTYSRDAYTADSVRLLSTLANNLGVALENARLFDEVQKKNTEITESLERETASNNILQVIAESPTDIQPVLDVIARSAAQLSGSEDALISLRDGDIRRVGAHYGDIPIIPIGEGVRFDRDSVGGRAIMEGRPLQAIHNQRGVKSEYPAGDKVAKKYGYRMTCAVPLMREGKAIGCISIRRVKPELLSEKQIALIQSFANQAAIAIANVRLFKAEQERAAELAIINSAQAALAAELSIQGIYDAIGNRIREIFHNTDMSIHIFDQKTNLLHFPYQYENGERFHIDSVPLPERGFTTHVIRTRETLVINQNMERDAEKYGAILIRGAHMEKSAVFVPLVIGDQARGVISLSDMNHEHAFSESNVRLLQTLANAMSVALENARLFDETQRLLKETEQRNAELAIINSVQGALAAQLDMQTIYDLVGEKIREIFDAQGAGITVVDRANKVIRVPYLVEDGQLFRDKTVPLGKGLISIVLETRHPLLLNSEAEMRAQSGKAVFPGTQKLPKSWLTVPIIIGEHAIGTLNVQNYRREQAFSESDVRLLQTLASSLGVALENARLFGETQRLLQETEHRAAELSVINALQAALASKLDIPSIYESVGDKLREIFNVQTVAIYTADLRTRMIHYDYAFEKGQKWQSKPRPFTGLHAHIVETVMKTRKSFVVNEDFDVFASQFVDYQAARSETPKSLIAVPILLQQDKLTGISLQNLEQESFFSESDVRLLETLANAMSVALENAHLLDETQRLLKETEQRAGELLFINLIGQTLTEELDLNTMLERVGDQLREAFDTKNIGIGLYDAKTNIMTSPYIYRNGEHVTVEPFELNDFNRRMSQNGRSMVINRNAKKAWKKTGGISASGETPKSFVLIPLMAGKELVGGITLQEFEREDAFTDLSVNLLETIAANMGTAIQNARLFNEVVRRKEYFEALFQNNPVAVVTIDNLATVTSWNPAAEKLFGYTREEAIGRNIDSLVAKRDDLYEQAVGLSQAGLEPQGGAFQSIVKRTRKDGTLVDVELSAVPIIVQGQKQGIYALYHDITELQRARQEAVAANEAKSAFLATMSHEIRTPMNAVIGMSGLLLDTSLNDDQRDFVETIRDSGDSLLNIINDILDFSKIEAGRMDIESQPFDLRACVESALDLVAARAIQKGLDTAYIFEDDVPAAVQGDETRLRQVLLNLLSNAVKFTETGEVVLTVSRVPSPNLRRGKNSEHESVSLVFSVRDTGIGLSTEGMSRLFQSFSQADSSTTRKYGGTGLGLAISKRLAEMMSGTMWAESEGLGRGSIFTFTITAPEADLPAPKRRDISGIQPQLKGRRLLIVDDNATNRRILNMQTNKWGMTTRDTESPNEALRWIHNGERFDLAILDMHMPEMDGLALAHEIRQQSASLPLILFSSLGRREVGEHSGEFAAYLTKPLKQSQLFDTLAGLFADAPAQPVESEPHRLQLDPGLAARHPLRILLAEDNAVNQKLALRILSQMGYSAEVASNGLETVEAVERRSFDLVLMDVQMPEMDGIEATRRIRASSIVARQPHIVGLTANAMQGDREKCLAAGMNDYITKPIRVEELVNALMNAGA